jgi:hypothetical protein
VPNAFRDSPFRQRGITIAADSRQGYRAQQTINLTTPESVHERRNATQPSTSSGSSRLRRVTETEPTDLDIDGGHRSSPAFAQGSFLRQPFNVPSTSHSYNVPTVPQFGQYIKTEDNYGHNTPFRGVSRQPAYNNLHRSGCKTAQRQIASGQDPESDENDTIEEVIRKKAWSRKVKAADNASPRVKLSKTLEFGSSRRSASGYSSQEVETNSKVREERQKHTLSRIRAPEFASKSSKESSLPHLSTLLVKDVPSRHVVMKQTAAQKAVALEKEKAELRRQQVAEETIAQRQQRAQELKGIDYLFEEVPVDQAALARIKKSKALDKARKYASEEAKIVEESDKTTQEKLAALRKQRAAEGLEEKKAEKKQRIEEQRQLEKKREEERLDAKRVSAVEMLRTKRVVEEEKRLEDLDKLEAEKQAAKKLAATLQSFKKPDSKPSSAGTAIQHKEPETAQDSGNLSDGGMFVLDDVVPLDNEEATEQYVTPADEGIIDKPARIQKPGTVVNDADVTLKELVTDVQKSETTKPDGHAAAASTYVQDSETVTDQPGATSTTVISEVQIYETIADKTYGHSTAALSSTQNPETVTDDGKVSQIVAASSAEKPEIVTKTQIPATLVSGTSISAVASDGRRRPPEISRPRVARRTSPDPIRFTGGRAAARDIQDSDHATASTTSHAHKKSQNRRADKGESQTQAKLQKTLKEVEKLKAKVKAEEGERKKEWDALMKQLGAMLTPQDREDIASRNQRNRPGKSQNLASEAREPHPTGKDSQLLSLTSQINFVSRIESQAKEKEKAEAARLAKYEKDKATCRRRYDREIRIVLNGQGIEPDDEKVSKQVDEKMVLWEVC